jgi:hypothetical protein
MKIYKFKDIRNPEKVLSMKDKRSDKTHSYPYCITRKEYAKLRPNEPTRRYDFVFVKGQMITADADLAQFLDDKYESIYFVDPKTGAVVTMDELDELSYRELMPLNAKYLKACKEMELEPCGDFRGKTTELREWIRKYRTMGVTIEEEVPEKEPSEMTEEEYREYRAEAVTVIKKGLMGEPDNHDEAEADDIIEEMLEAEMVELGIGDYELRITNYKLPESEKPLSDMTEEEYREFATESIRKQLETNPNVSDIDKVTEDIIVKSIELYRVGTNLPTGTEGSE